MSKTNQGIIGLISVLLLSTGLLSSTAMAEGDAVAQGKKLAFDRKKGNCLGCHVIEGGDLPGNIGPPLIAMKARFPKKEDIRAQIFDATVRNPHTVMPPFGKHRILSDKEIDLIADFIYTL